MTSSPLLTWTPVPPSAENKARSHSVRPHRMLGLLRHTNLGSQPRLIKKERLLDRRGEDWSSFTSWLLFEAADEIYFYSWLESKFDFIFPGLLLTFCLYPLTDWEYWVQQVTVALLLLCSKFFKSSDFKIKTFILFKGDRLGVENCFPHLLSLYPLYNKGIVHHIMSSNGRVQTLVNHFALPTASSVCNNCNFTALWDW